MRNIFVLVKKNLKLLIRSKSSALIVILGPLLVVFLAGMAFDNTKTYSISLGTYSQEYNEMSESFIQNLEENQFTVTKYNDEETCIEMIKEGTTHSCIVFSPEFALGQDMNNQIIFYVDYSKINLVYMVLDTMAESIGQKSEELSINLTTVLLDILDSTRNEVIEKKSTIITLTTKNDDAGKKMGEAYSTLESLDVSTKLTTSSVADLSSKKSKVSAQVNNLEIVAEDALDEARSLIEDIEYEIESSALSDAEKSEILGVLNDSSDEFDEIETSLEETSNLTSGNLQELSAAIGAVSLGIEDAMDTLNKASIARTTSLTSLDSAKGLINEAIQNIAILQNSLNTIESNINSIAVTKASDIVNPVETTIKPVVAEKTHLNYIFPVLMVLVLMFTGILLSTTLIMIEKKTTAYFRNFMSPTKDITFISSTFITCMLLLLVQVAVILGLSTMFFGSRILHTLPKSIPILFFCMALFTLTGMLVGYIFNSEETATLGAISLGSVFLLLSDVILPIESMSQTLFNIAQYNPFVLSSSLLRKAIIHDVPFASIETGLVRMLAYCIAIVVFVIAVQSVTKKHYISKYLKKIAAKPEPPKESNNNEPRKKEPNK